MGKMDWTKPEIPQYRPGAYLCEIRKAEERESKTSGMRYMNVELHEVGENFDGASTLVGWDILMMEGKGVGLAQAKLKVLGFDGTEEEIHPQDLIGRRAWVTWENQDYNGEKRLKVAASFRPVFSCGYVHKDTPPTNASSGTALIEDDTPF